MKRLAPVLFVGALLLTVSENRAEASKPINLALFDPIQIFDSSTAIEGFRFNLIYGYNSSMVGFDLGLVNRIAGETVGFQLGFVGMSGSFKGWQYNGIFNQADKVVGLQTGMVNYSDQVTGVQFAVVNIASKLHGLQLGLINFAKNGFLPIFPFFNFGTK